MNVQDCLSFKGNWRSYQARVLKRADNYLDDNNIHIVAAPGSGKTTLGIELICKLAEPALVLAPTVTIREQWQSRIEEGFLNEGCRIEEVASQNLKKPAMITISTYQALHSAMTRFKGELREEEIEESKENTKEAPSVKENIEEVDFAAFDLIKTAKEAGIKVLCLDECHHLRSEWWKALEQFREEMGELRVIALTATPPYDSTPAMWERYIKMCGEIDEEITIPELVKEGSLCPHQDFVYFNYPTTEEKQKVTEYYRQVKILRGELLQDEKFLEAVQKHAVFTGEMSLDEILAEPAYLSALLIFLQARHIPIDKQYYQLMGVKEFPYLKPEWLELLLQKFLYDDSQHFFAEKSYVEEVREHVKAMGLIEKRRVMLQKSDTIEKIMLSSKGKSNSILKIAEHEYENMGSGLRMLILTDYIRKETEKHIGETDAKIEQLGVLPFFEQLRRHFAKKKTKAPKLGVLCGSIVVIPAQAKEELLSIVPEGKVTFSTLGKLDQEEYLKLSPVGDGHFLTAAVTELFSRGQIQILIGTKSLLGEGWDSPCINSLILASFVGSYMLSNQMRGRAIRVMKDQPEKTSNIWHLVCIHPKENAEQSDDFLLLKRKMQHFLGLHYEKDSIESGLQRLSYIEAPYNKLHVEQINKKMLSLSEKREELKERWDRSLAVSKEMEIVKETQVPEEELNVAVVYDAIRNLIIACIFNFCWLAFVIGNVIAGNKISYGMVCLFMILLEIVLGAVTRMPRLMMLLSPYKRLQKMGDGIVNALKAEHMLNDENARAHAEHNEEDSSHSVYLLGGSGQDKNLFAKCMQEFYAPIDNQRYLLVEHTGHKGKNSYFAVPDLFAGKKNLAENFVAAVRPYIGRYDLVYTRNEAGRKILLKARTRSLANQQMRCITREKVQSKLK